MGKKEGRSKAIVTIKDGKKTKKNVAEETSKKSSKSKEIIVAPKRPHRFHPGVQSKRQAKKLMESEDRVCSAKPIHRLLKHVVLDLYGEKAQVIVQEGFIPQLASVVDLYLTSRFEEAADNASNYATEPKKTIQIMHYERSRVKTKSSLPRIKF